LGWHVWVRVNLTVGVKGVVGWWKKKMVLERGQEKEEGTFRGPKRGVPDWGARDGFRLKRRREAQ